MTMIGLIFLSHLPNSLAGPCEDDAYFTFGRYYNNNKKAVIRTCSWIKEDAKKAARRKKFWCKRKWILNNRLIEEKCPSACGKCTENVIVGSCSNLSPRDSSPNLPLQWYDAIGEKYDCFYYSFGDNCNIFGDGFSNFGWTAKQACCTCGGGKIKRQT